MSLCNLQTHWTHTRLGAFERLALTKALHGGSRVSRFAWGGSALHSASKLNSPLPQICTSCVSTSGHPLQQHHDAMVSCTPSQVTEADSVQKMLIPAPRQEDKLAWPPASENSHCKASCAKTRLRHGATRLIVRASDLIHPRPHLARHLRACYPSNPHKLPHPRNPKQAYQLRESKSGALDVSASAINPALHAGFSAQRN